MKNVYVDSLVTGADFDDFFMMKSAAVRTGSNQKQYIDMVLADKTGDVSAKKWDASESDITEIGDFDIDEFIKTAPEKGPDMYAEILAKAESVGDEELRKVAVALMERNKEKLMYYPAASKNHHAEMCGLLYHIKRMLLMGEKACEVYTDLDRDWVVTGVIIHDMEKLNEIMSNQWGISPGYSMEGQLLGHIAQGVKMIDKLADELGISEALSARCFLRRSCCITLIFSMQGYLTWKRRSSLLRREISLIRCGRLRTGECISRHSGLSESVC